MLSAPDVAAAAAAARDRQGSHAGAGRPGRPSRRSTKPATRSAARATSLLKLFGQQQAATAADTARPRPKSIVDDRFEDLRRWCAASRPARRRRSTPRSALINELYTLLTATEAALKGGTTPPPSEVPNKIKAEGSRMPEPVRSLLLTLSGGGASQAMVVTRANLGQALKAGVSASSATRRSPGAIRSSSGSARDVTPGRLRPPVRRRRPVRRLLPEEPGAVRQHQHAAVELSRPGRGQPRRQRRRAGAVPARAGDPRSVLPRRHPRPGDAARIQAAGDGRHHHPVHARRRRPAGQVRHGPQVPAQVQWPGPRGSTQVRLQLSPPAQPARRASCSKGRGRCSACSTRSSSRAARSPRSSSPPSTSKAARRSSTSHQQRAQPVPLRELEQFQCPGQL